MALRVYRLPERADVPDPRDQTEIAVEILSAANVLKDAVSSLKPKERKVLKLRFFNDGRIKNSYRNIASIVGLSAEGCRFVLLRAKEKIRQYFKKQGLF